MSNAAALALDTYVPGSDREAEELIDGLLADATFETADEERITDRATLEDMLGEAEIIRIRGMEFHAVPPSIKSLSGVLQLMGKSDKVMAPPKAWSDKYKVFDDAVSGIREMLSIGIVKAEDVVWPAPIEPWEPSREATEMALQMRIEAARRLLWVKDESQGAASSIAGAASGIVGAASGAPTLRMARAEEIADRFPATRLLTTILTILARNGMELDDEKKSLSRTGKTSSAD